MKKLFILLLIVASLNAGAQKNGIKEAAKEAAAETKKDSVNINTIPLFTLQDMQDLFVQVINIMPDNYKAAVDAWIRQRLNQKLQPKK